MWNYIGHSFLFLSPLFLFLLFFSFSSFSFFPRTISFLSSSWSVAIFFSCFIISLICSLSSSAPSFLLFFQTRSPSSYRTNIIIKTLVSGDLVWECDLREWSKGNLSLGEEEKCCFEGGKVWALRIWMLLSSGGKVWVRFWGNSIRISGCEQLWFARKKKNSWYSES